jgi:hypothetical protein
MNKSNNTSNSSNTSNSNKINKFKLEVEKEKTKQLELLRDIKKLELKLRLNKNYQRKQNKSFDMYKMISELNDDNCSDDNDNTNNSSNDKSNNSSNDDNILDSQSQQYQNQNIIPSPTYNNNNMNDLLSNDVKKQLDALENQFYFNDCRI